MNTPDKSMNLAHNLPHPDSVTAAQVDTLLRVAGTLMGVLVNPMRGMDNVPGESDPDGCVKESAEATFINVCNRLDEIVTDPTRFSMAFQNKIEARSEEITQASLNVMNAQAAAAAEILSPHFRFRPILQKTGAGDGWIAYLGDIAGDSNNTIFGIGASPAAAIVAFDQVFSGELPVGMLEWLLLREQSLNAGIPFPSAPENQKTNEPKTRSVESRRNRKTNKSSRSRRNDKGDSGNPS